MSASFFLNFLKYTHASLNLLHNPIADWMESNEYITFIYSYEIYIYIYNGFLIKKNISLFKWIVNVYKSCGI